MVGCSVGLLAAGRYAWRRRFESLGLRGKWVGSGQFGDSDISRSQQIQRRYHLRIVSPDRIFVIGDQDTASWRDTAWRDPSIHTFAPKTNRFLTFMESSLGQEKPRNTALDIGEQWRSLGRFQHLNDIKGKSIQFRYGKSVSRYGHCGVAVRTLRRSAARLWTKKLAKARGNEAALGSEGS